MFDHRIDYRINVEPGEFLQSRERGWIEKCSRVDVDESK
jgi:hypothetical protein